MDNARAHLQPHVIPHRMSSLGHCVRRHVSQDYIRVRRPTLPFTNACQPSITSLLGDNLLINKHQLISYLVTCKVVTMTGKKSYVDQVSAELKRASTKQAQKLWLCLSSL